MVMRVAHEARNRLLMHQASDASGGRSRLVLWQQSDTVGGAPGGCIRRVWCIQGPGSGDASGGLARHTHPYIHIRAWRSEAVEVNPRDIHSNIQTGTCRAWGRFLEWGVGPAQQRSGKTPGDDRFVAWQKFDKSHMHGARAH
eukprot:scaffold137319_cov20-Tisochrysis_lutea.AAC.2